MNQPASRFRAELLTTRLVEVPAGDGIGEPLHSEADVAAPDPCRGPPASPGRSHSGARNSATTISVQTAASSNETHGTGWSTSPWAAGRLARGVVGTATAATRGASRSSAGVGLVVGHGRHATSPRGDGDGYEPQLSKCGRRLVDVMAPHRIIRRQPAGEWVAWARRAGGGPEPVGLFCRPEHARQEPAPVPRQTCGPRTWWRRRPQECPGCRRSLRHCLGPVAASGSPPADRHRRG
jgi:hypothetical protein